MWAAKLARCALTPAEASACLQWAETQPVPPDAAAHYALLAFLKARSEEQLPDYSNNDDDAAAAAPPSAAADLLAAEKLTPFGNTRQNQCNAAASGGRPATKPAGQQQQQQQQQAPPAAGESLKHLVPSSMLLTGTIPVALTDAFDPEGSSAVERVIDENQKLLRNLKQLEDDLFRSECFAVRETEERSKLLDAFATTREENLALKQQNESLRTRLLLTASMESDARNETKVSLERLEAEIARMNAERGALSQAKRRTEDEKKRLEKNARAMQQVYQREHGDMQQQLRTLAQEIEHKASLVDDLVEREKRLARAKQQNEKAMQLMEAEKERLRQELERALRRLEDSEHVGEKLERMQEDLRRQYEARLKEQDANLQGMRKKQRNAQQLLRQQGSDYQKIQKLLSEVSHLRTEQGELKNAMKYKCDEREAERDQRTKQLNQLQRQMRQLETQNVRYSNSLKVKEETLNRLQQQLSVEKTKTKHLSEIQKEVEKKQTWLDKEIEIQRKKHEAQERLSRELKRRERILKEREDNQSARDDMRKTKERSNFGRLERGLQGWDSQITSIEAKLKKARSEQECIPPQNRHAENSAFAEVTSEIDCLEAELASARIKYQEVQQAHLEAAELDNQLRHIDDRIDVLQAALEYGEDIIHQTEREIEDLTKAGQTVADQVAAAEERGGTCESPETQPASGTPPPPASLPPAASCPKQLLDPLFDTPRPPASNAPSTAPASQPPATTPRRASAGGEQDGSVRTASSEGGDAAGTAVCSGGSVSPAPAGSQEAAKQAGNPPSVTPPFRPSDAPSAGCRSAGDDLTPPPASSLTPADCIALLASPGSSEQQQQPQQPPPCAKQPTAEEFQKTLQQYARKVRVLNQAERTREQEVQGLRRQHDEQAQTIEKLRNALRLADMGFNRRLLKVQLEHEKILSRLIVNSSDSSSVVQ
ncbi:Kinesin-like protein KIN-4A [Diplonema papillatum]|nr:Kinesin-like protein KIN-4A [Diplonema papillatum]